MRKNKVLKSILMSTLGISAIGSIVAISTSCEEKKPDVVPVTGVSLDKTSTTLHIGETETLLATILPETATDKSVTWTSSNPSVATVENGEITAVSEGTATIIVTTHDGGEIATCKVTVDAALIHVTSVSLNKHFITLGVGHTETLLATVLPEDATDKSVTWTSSDTNVATVDSNGTITAKAVGNATITAITNDGGKTDTCRVTANPIPVTGVTLNKSSTTLVVGGAETLTATVSPEDATDKSVTWTSSNPSVATVDSNGKITAKGLGNVIITATTNDGGKTAACAVTVNPIHVTGVTLDKTSATLAVGETETLTATVLPTDAADKLVNWTSSDTSVATVEKGKITAVAVGTATIIVTTHDGGKTATCTVTVNPVHVTSIKLNKTSIDLEVGDTETLIATVLPTDAANKDIIWTSSDTSVATIDSNGTITAVGLGDATITVTSVDNPNAKAACEVNVNPTHVTSVELNKNETALHIGDAETLTATVLPEDATNKDVTWSSSDISIAAVDSNGTITAVAEGTATITVTTNDGGKTATCEVNVDTIHVTGITLNKNSINLTEGQTETLTATVLPENATDKSVNWTSSNTSVATVEKGKITAVAVGTATIIVTTHDGGKTATCKVTVNPTIVTDVVITANEYSTLQLNNVGGNNPDLQYSTDGTDWFEYSAPINIPQGQSLYLKGNNPTGWSSSNSAYSTLSITGNVSISGNVMALLDNGAKPGEQGDISDVPNQGCFYNLFQSSTGITSVSEYFLPATTLAEWCYVSMFSGCTSLTTAPELPATTLKNSCYYGMFWDCSSLTAAPELPATDLKSSCYYGMFRGCSSLTTAPELPATTLAYGCYYMMFKDCSSLDSIRIGYTGDYDRAYFFEWVDGIASPGVFYYNGNDTVANFGFSSSWTIHRDELMKIFAYEYSTLTLNNNGGNNPDLQYSKDYVNWTTYSAPINITRGQSLYLKGNNPNGWSHGDAIYSTLSITGDVSISGSVMALLDNGAAPGEQGDITTNIPCDYCFYNLFEDSTGITSVSEDFLPATSLADNCYDSMFDWCSSLRTAPNLPATSLANGCYNMMFYICTSLTTAPALPATTLTDNCYRLMFFGCTSLTTAPDLPATSLANNCYDSMFDDCSSLTTAPDLLATTLAEGCYEYMFSGCSSLTTAPELPATTLADFCYGGMFSNCSSLNSIKICYTGNYNSIYFTDWVYGVASSGTFYYNGSDTCANFGFPSGWTKTPF